MKDNQIVVGISQGDINGIGYEVIIKTLEDSRILELCTPVVYGSPKVLAYHRKAINVANFVLNTINSAADATAGKGHIVNCVDDAVKVELGRSTPQAGESSYLALQRVVEEIKERKVDVLVTAPINKENIKEAGFEFPGHTEYLQKVFNANESLMIMVSQQLKVAVATGHIALKDVASTLTPEVLNRKIKLFNQSLQRDFAIRKPRIAVLGLNPHAGEHGVIGKEEDDMMTPVMNRLRDEGIMVFGPFPADGFFGTGAFAKYDGVLAMYHDQGLIPFKTISMDSGVNYTAGLPVVRTSPAHGTAFDIAGEGKASEDSFRNALYLAIDVFRNRKMHAEANRNPLRKQDISYNMSGPDISVDELEDNTPDEDIIPLG